MEKKFTHKILSARIFLKKIYFSLLTAAVCASTFSLSNAQGSWDYEVYNSGTPISRHENAFVECGGKFYLLGGRTLGVTKYVNIYDPTTKAWTSGAASDIELHHFQAVCYNNLIYVIAALTGNYPNETPVDKIYIYNPATNTWSYGPTIPADRRRGSAGVAVYNNKIYIAGGNTNGHNGGYVNQFDVFDPASGVWTPLPNAPRPRDHVHAVIIDNKLVLAAGRLSSSASILVPETDVYDLTTQQWLAPNTYPNIPTLRAGAPSVALNDEVVVMGGEATSDVRAEVQALNINTKTWRNLDFLNTARHGTQAIVYNGKIYISAGSNAKGGSSSTQLTSTEVFTASGIQSLKNSESMVSSYYPNPTEEKITLSLSEVVSGTVKVNVLNAHGRVMKEVDVTSHSDVEIVLTEFPQGMYFLTIQDLDQNVQQTVKIIKK